MAPQRDEPADPAPCPSGPPEALERLREDLRPVTVATLDGLLGDVAARALHREQRVPALLAARAAGGPAATLLRLFVLGDDATRGELDSTLPRTRTAGAEALGLVRSAGADDDDRVRAVVDLQPERSTDAAGDVDWWIASDRGELATGGPLRPDHVLGVGGASLTLAGLTVRVPRERTLDVGTGCGIQALHAARHSTAVVATDVSRRALAFARFNAALAGADVELRGGSMLEPVAGEEFDLVVSNPPFVITPAAAYAVGLPVMEYRDGGRAGDDLVADLVRGVGAQLRPGGIAQLLGNWEHRDGEDWRQRVGSWLEESGLDGWVVQREVQDPAEYAELWLRDGGMRPGPEFEEAYEAWLGDFAARGVAGIGFGYVTMHRPSAGRAPWRRVEEVVGPVRPPLGGHVADVLLTRDRLLAAEAAAGDRGTGAVLTGERLVVAGDVTEERYLRPGAADPEVLQLRQGGGLGRVVRPGTLVAGAVGVCDGELTVGQVVAGLAALLELPAQDVAAEVLPAVRELLVDGFLRYA